MNKKSIAILLLAVLILPLMSAGVKGESLKERDQEFIQEYNTAKAKYLKAEQTYKSAREDYKTLRAKVNKFKGLDDKSPAFEKAEKFLTNALEAMSSYNEILIVWAENIKMAPELRENILDELNWHTDKIAELQSEVNTATTTDELITISKKIKNHWLDQRVSIKRVAGRLLSARAEHALRRANTLADNLQEKIDEKVAAGQLDSNNKYQQSLDDYKADIALAEERYNDAVEKWQSIKSIPDLAPADKEAKQFFRQANQHLRDAHKTLVTMVREWKKEFKTIPQTNTETTNTSTTPGEEIYDVVVGGTGRLIASGDGIALLDGNGKVTITGSEGTLKVTDFNGDSKIVIAGEGNMTQDGNQKVYTGFNGDATIEGTSIKVEIDGTGIQFVAEGEGSAMLSGTGSYTVGKLTGKWKQTGVVVTLGEQ